METGKKQILKQTELGGRLPDTNSIDSEVMSDSIVHEYENVNDEVITKLREMSRHNYLKKREIQKIFELQMEIRDEEKLFLHTGLHLTQGEMKNLNYKRKALALATERNQLIQNVNETAVTHLPKSSNAIHEDENSKQKSGNDRHEKNNSSWTEQEDWESQQSQSTRNIYGATKRFSNKDEYTLVFENEMNFLRDRLIESPFGKEKKNDFDSECQRVLHLQHCARENLCKLREALPIFQHKWCILDTLEKYQVLIVEAETGSGKTTQITQYLLEAGYAEMGMIGCTQPRRIAAMAVAARVAKEMNVHLGREVGYSIRFEDCTSDKTIIKYMTDGMLLREFLTEPDLSSYSAMIIDEAHERTLHTDILFGLVKDVTRFRPNLKLIVSSATLDANKFSEYFDDAPIYKIPGRMYPVDVFFAKSPAPDYLESAVQAVFQIHVSEESGDILVFLTGQEEIELCEEKLKNKINGLHTKIGELIVTPLYANLPTELQARIFEPTPEGTRKAVIATNIAETSVTIVGIKYVIDPGFTKQNLYNPKSGIETLVVSPVSQSSARQRAGRAGRTAAGKCYRLYTKWIYENELEVNTIPEIQRTNLANAVLLIKSLGINDLVGFGFIDAPPTETIIRSLEQLYALGALNDRGELTKLGRRMAEFPIEPQVSKMLVISENYKVSDEVATIVAMLSCRTGIFYRPKQQQIQADNALKNFQRGEVGDHITLLKVYNGWKESDFAPHYCLQNFIQYRTMNRVRDIRDQIVGLMERVEIGLISNTSDYSAIRKCITSGFFSNVAKLRRDGSYQAMKKSMTMFIHPCSSMSQVNPKYVVYHELVFTTKEYMRNVSEIEPLWLIEVAPHIYSQKELDLPNFERA